MALYAAASVAGALITPFRRPIIADIGWQTPRNVGRQVTTVVCQLENQVAKATNATSFETMDGRIRTDAQHENHSTGALSLTQACPLMVCGRRKAFVLEKVLVLLCYALRYLQHASVWQQLWQQFDPTTCLAAFRWHMVG